MQANRHADSLSDDDDAYGADGDDDRPGLLFAMIHAQACTPLCHGWAHPMNWWPSTGAVLQWPMKAV